MNKRIGYAAGFLFLLFIEIIIALYLHDAFIRPYGGDILVVALLYSFIRIFKPNGIKWLPLYVFLFAVTVEFLQYFRLAHILGIGKHTIPGIILGSVYDIKDIICYAVGCMAIALIEKIKQIRTATKNLEKN